MHLFNGERRRGKDAACWGCPKLSGTPGRKINVKTESGLSKPNQKGGVWMAEGSFLRVGGFFWVCAQLWCFPLLCP